MSEYDCIDYKDLNYSIFQSLNFVFNFLIWWKAFDHFSSNYRGIYFILKNFKVIFYNFIM